jgi:hypothetical protein
MASCSGTRGRREEGRERAISCRAVPGFATGDGAGAALFSGEDALRLYMDGTLLSVYNCLRLSLAGMNFSGV